MTKKLLCALLLMLALPTGATLYKVVKPDGTVVYTDKKQPGAILVKIGNANSATIPAFSPQKAKPQLKKQLKPPVNYQLSILQPADQQTIRSNPGNLKVSAKLTPITGGQFQLFINQTLVKTQLTPQFELSNVDRGELQIEIKFINSKGKVLATSPVHTVYLHRASILSPARRK